MLKKGITDLIIDTVLQIKKIDSETIKVFGIFCYFTTRTGINNLTFKSIIKHIFGQKE